LQEKLEPYSYHPASSYHTQTMEAWYSRYCLHSYCWWLWNQIYKARRCWAFG
jgi:hypothetical protein